MASSARATVFKAALAVGYKCTNAGIYPDDLKNLTNAIA
jgi:hypothetical protein